MLKQTREQYSNNNLTQALESIEAAASLPGFNQNNDLLDLNREIGKYCRIAGFRSCSKEFYKTYHDQELTGIGATFSPDNRYLLTLFYAEYKGAIWDTLKLRAKPQDRAYTSAFSSGVYKAALCREGTLLAGDCIPVHEYGNNTIGTYDLALNKAKTCVHVHKEFLTSFFVNHPDPTITDIDDLIFELQNKGLGWILREGVEKKISELKPKKPLVAAPKEKLFHRVFKKGSK